MILNIDEFIEILIQIAVEKTGDSKWNRHKTQMRDWFAAVPSIDPDTQTLQEAPVRDLIAESLQNQIELIKTEITNLKTDTEAAIELTEESNGQFLSIVDELAAGRASLEDIKPLLKEATEKNQAYEISLNSVNNQLSQYQNIFEKLQESVLAITEQIAELRQENAQLQQQIKPNVPEIVPNNLNLITDSNLLGSWSGLINYHKDRGMFSVTSEADSNLMVLGRKGGNGGVCLLYLGLADEEVEFVGENGLSVLRSFKGIDIFEWVAIAPKSSGGYWALKYHEEFGKYGLHEDGGQIRWNSYKGKIAAFEIMNSNGTRKQNSLPKLVPLST